VLDFLPSCDAAYLYKHPDGIYGLSLKSKRDFEKDDYIMEYVGRQMTMEEAERKQKLDAIHGLDTCYQVSVGKNYVIDAMFDGNLARFANSSHYPNMRFDMMIVDGVMRSFLTATREIKQHDDLVADYGPDYRDNSDRFVQCWCQEKECSGLISVKKKDLCRMWMKSPMKFPIVDQSAIRDFKTNETELNRRCLEQQWKIRGLEWELEEANIQMKRMADEIRELKANQQRQEDVLSPDLDVNANDAHDDLPVIADLSIDDDDDSSTEIEDHNEDTESQEQVSDNMEVDAGDQDQDDDMLGHDLHERRQNYRDAGNAKRKIACPKCLTEYVGKGQGQNAVIHFIVCESISARALARFFHLEKQQQASGDIHAKGGNSIGVKETHHLKRVGKFDDCMREMNDME
jgi:hypothetical protein